RLRMLEASSTPNSSFITLTGKEICGYRPIKHCGLSRSSHTHAPMENTLTSQSPANAPNEKPLDTEPDEIERLLAEAQKISDEIVDDVPSAVQEDAPLSAENILEEAESRADKEPPPGIEALRPPAHAEPAANEASEESAHTPT